MFVYAAVVEITIPCRSLKGKRGIVKSILARARNRFNLSGAEVDRQDDWGTAILGFASVSGSRLRARQILEQLEAWLVAERPDVDVVGFDITEC
jgi:uncharacterized protein YlxP (DUF503 family)